MDPNILKKLNAARHARQACVLVTDLTDGRDRLVLADDAILIAGELGDAISKTLRSGKSATIDIDGRQFFLNSHVPPLRIVAVGAVHISQALASIAKITDFDIEIIDPRTAFASPERFPDIDLFADWPEEVLKSRPLDAYTALVAVTHDPKLDDSALIAALEAECIYVGALGSRKTQSARVERLKGAGLSDAKISRIASPIGLDIGAATPAEIAVAIMAEIIATLRGPKSNR